MTRTISKVLKPDTLMNWGDSDITKDIKRVVQVKVALCPICAAMQWKASQAASLVYKAIADAEND